MKSVLASVGKRIGQTGFPQLATLCLLLVSGPAPAQQGEQEIPSGTVGGYHGLNVFGPEGGKCMDACGPGCPDTCEVLEFSRCHREQANSIVSGKRYTCGTHQSCADHDSCLEACRAASPNRDDYGTTDFLLGACERQCHITAAGEADDIVGGSARDIALAGRPRGARGASRYGPTARAIGGWMTGGGPQSSNGIWDYTKETPDSPEAMNSCRDCEKCETRTLADGSTKGVCVPKEDECPPCVSCGDVHISTLDKLRYNFQGAGEFVLFEDVSREHVAQIRTEPAFNYRSISFNTAVAMRVAGDVLAIHVAPELRVVLNRQSIDLAETEDRELPGGGMLARAGSRITVRWPDGSVIQARMTGYKYMDVAAYLSPSLAGQVRGLVGDYDGDPDNDMRTRDGEQLQRRVDKTVLYGRFGQGWQIRQDESLFWYAPGESVATFARPEFPDETVQLADLDPDAVAAAEQACADEGIEHPRLFSDCVFDIAVTGDFSLASSHWFTSIPAATSPATYFMDSAVGSVTLVAPTDVQARSAIDIEWTGDRAVGDFLAITLSGAPTDALLSYQVIRGGQTATMYAPETTGSYELRYMQGEKIAAISALNVVPVTATLDAPAAMDAGARVDVAWTGPGNRADFIGVALPDAAPDKFLKRAYTNSGNPVRLELPEDPGDYELRYQQGQSNAVLAKRRIEIRPVTATLDAPAAMDAGARVDVAWTGPGNRADFIGVALPDAAADKFVKRAYTNSGNPARIELPEEPGDYELRYQLGQSNAVLAKRRIEIRPVTATLDAPAAMDAGARVDVAWTGPGNRADFIGVALPDAAADKFVKRAYTNSGNPARIELPEEPGDYELRYQLGQSNAVLATRRIEIRPVTATLDAPAAMDAGARVDVAWTGPGNRADFIGVALPDAAADKFVKRAYTNSGNPARIELPEEPGDYELRYQLGQSNAVLATRRIEIRPVTATLDAPAAMDAGARVDVAWTGPGNRADFIAVAQPDALPSKFLARAYTNSGNPVRLDLPEEPGAYELRYQQGQSANVLSRRTIEVRLVSDPEP